MDIEAVEPGLITFMYFLHTDPGHEDTPPNEFYEKWSNLYYDFADMSNGVHHE